MDLSILLPLSNHLELTRECLASLERTTRGARWEVILVDDATIDGTREFLRGLRTSRHRALFNEGSPRGTAACLNAAARVARGGILCALSPAAVLLPGWLQPMLRLIQRLPNVGCVGSVHREPISGLIDHTGVIFDVRGLPTDAGRSTVSPPVEAYTRWPAVSASCCLARRQLHGQLGGFDEALALELSGIDFCLRASEAAGARHYTANRSVIYLHRGNPAGGNLPEGGPRDDRSRWMDANTSRRAGARGRALTSNGSRPNWPPSGKPTGPPPRGATCRGVPRQRWTRRIGRTCSARANASGTGVGRWPGKTADSGGRTSPTGARTAGATWANTPRSPGVTTGGVSDRRWSRFFSRVRWLSRSHPSIRATATPAITTITSPTTGTVRARRRPDIPTRRFSIRRRSEEPLVGTVAVACRNGNFTGPASRRRRGRAPFTWEKPPVGESHAPFTSRQPPVHGWYEWKVLLPTLANSRPVAWSVLSILCSTPVPMLPTAILRLWFLSLLSPGLIGAGVYLAHRWYQQSWGYDPSLHRSFFDPHFRLDEPTLCVLAAAFLLVVALAGGLIVRLFIGLGSGGQGSGSGRGTDSPKVGAPPVSQQRLTRPDGSELHVEFYGSPDAPPIVLTHGWGLNGAEWNYLKRELTDRFRLIVWEEPGLGRSTRPGNRDYSLENLARDLEAVLSLAGGKPAILLGHSIGGMIILTFCRLFPEALGARVAALVLTHTTYTNPVRTTKGAAFYSAIEKPVLMPLMYLTVALSPLLWLSSWLSYLNGSAHLSTKRSSFAGTESWEQIDFATRFNLQASPAVLARGMMGMMRYDATATLKAVSVPTLVVAGDRDSLCKPEASERMRADVPGARLAMLSPAKHLGLIEHHARYAELVREFASAVQTRGTGPLA